jgi:4'-phosphopantetheinyl transferase EntD
LISNLKIISGKEFLIGVAPIQNIHKNPSILSENEKKELEEISHPARIESWWKARQILNEISSRKGIEYQGLRKGENGKPHFVKGSSYHCSLSHSSGFAAAIISQRSCGIDVELIHPKVERILTKFSSESELQGKKEVKYMTALWACKESIYKAVDIPGILFKEQIILKKWNGDSSSAYFDFLGMDGKMMDFECEINWLGNQVLASALQ